MKMLCRRGLEKQRRQLHEGWLLKVTGVEEERIVVLGGICKWLTCSFINVKASSMKARWWADSYRRPGLSEWSSWQVPGCRRDYRGSPWRSGLSHSTTILGTSSRPGSRPSFPTWAASMGSIAMAITPSLVHSTVCNALFPILKQPNTLNLIPSSVCSVNYVQILTNML